MGPAEGLRLSANSILQQLVRGKTKRNAPSGVALKFQYASLKPGQDSAWDCSGATFASSAQVEQT